MFHPSRITIKILGVLHLFWARQGELVVVYFWSLLLKAPYERQCITSIAVVIALSDGAVFTHFQGSFLLFFCSTAGNGYSTARQCGYSVAPVNLCKSRLSAFVEGSLHSQMHEMAMHTPAKSM